MPLPKKITPRGVAPSKSEQSDTEAPAHKPLYARVMDTLNRPGAALAGGLSEILTSPSRRKTGVYERVKQNLWDGTRKDDFDTFLGERGMGDTAARATLGFVGDVALDPLNLVPFGGVGKKVLSGIRKGGEMALGAKGAAMFSNYANLDDAGRKVFKLADARIQALPDVLATRFGRQAKRLRQANPSLDIAGVRTALTAQTNPTIYPEAKANELLRLASEVVGQYGQGGNAIKGQTRRINIRKLDKEIRHVLKGQNLPNNIADHLQRRLLDIPTETFVDKVPALKYLIRKPTDVFRELATVWRPKFHTNNALGNLENIYKSGTSMNDLRKALPVAYKFGQAFDNSAKLTKQQLMDVLPGTNVRLLDALRAFERYGLQHGIGDLTGITSASPGANILEKTIDLAAKGTGSTRERLKDVATTGGLGTRMANLYRYARDAGPKRFGDAIERKSKTLKYVDSLLKGKSPEDAVLDVQEALFNYRDLAPVEKNLREIMPFYSFSRKNLPVQGSSLLTNPRKWERIGDFQNLISNASTTEDQMIDPNLAPKFIEDMGGFQAHIRDTPNPQFMIPNLAGQDINKLDVLSPLETAKEWLNGLSPITKAGIELPLNRTIFDNREIYDKDYGPLKSYTKAPESIQMLPEALQRFLTRDRREMKYGKLTGNTVRETPAMVAYAARQLPALQSLGKASLAMSDPAVLSNQAAGASEIAGLPIYEVSPETMLKQSRWQARENKRLKTKKTNIEKRTVRQQQDLLDALELLGIDINQ